MGRGYVLGFLFGGAAALDAGAGGCAWGRLFAAAAAAAITGGGSSFSFWCGCGSPEAMPPTSPPTAPAAAAIPARTAAAAAAVAAIKPTPRKKREPKGSLFFMQHYSSFAGKGTVPFSIRSVIAATAPRGILRCASIIRLRMAALLSSRRTAERVSRTLSVPSAIP